MYKDFKGVVVPMVTPVDAGGKIDCAAVDRIMQRFCTCGVAPLVMGTTGEGNSVSKEQAAIFVEQAAKSAAGRVKIYVGLSGCCTEEHIEAANRYHKLGADAIVATLPSYYTLTPGQMYAYYVRLAESITAPLMIYNITSTTHMSIPVEIVKRLSTHPNIVGLKDSERDEERMYQCLGISKNNEKFAYFLGWAAKSAECVGAGGDGIVPSTGNFVPEMFADLYNAAAAGKMDEAIALQTATDAIARIYQEGRTLGQSLAALKVMMQTVGLCGPDMLSPLTHLTAAEEAEIVRRTAEINR
ncbi:MAG: dihydrodipicolinate synthase family protein [Rikenellaceae bacterium]|jgi:4-hydroxy-tetrahydrodipicolinate synthase|nr:dihydrodipicolinate synthase family protein [Rikenellaceae bacterium]